MSILSQEFLDHFFDHGNKTPAATLGLPLASTDMLFDYYKNYKASTDMMFDYFKNYKTELIPDALVEAVPEEHHDTVIIVAVCLAILVVFSIVKPLFDLMFSGRQPRSSKTVPPMGPTFDELVEYWKKGEPAYWALRTFRELEQESDDRCCGVFEVQTSYILRFFLGGRVFLARDGPTVRKILEEPSTLKWKQGYQMLKDISGSAFGDNFLSESDNDWRWKHVRKSTNTAFSPANIRLISRNVISKIVDEWMDNTLATMKEGQPIDIHYQMKLVTAKVIVRAAFDYELPEKEAALVLKHMETCGWEFGAKSLGDPLRSMSLTRWMYKGIREARESTGYLRTFCRKLLAHHHASLQESSSSSSKSGQQSLIIDFLINDANYKNDDERISDMIMYMGAGFDTTAGTLAFALLELAKNPAEQETLRRALVQQQQQNKQQSCPPELKHVVRETLRLHVATANGSGRIIKQDISVDGSPYVIPAGSIVTIPLFAVLRNGEVYQDPDEFIPSRWETPSEQMMQTFIPFATGSRNCQGQALANAEMEVVLSKLIANYEFKVVEEGTTTCPMTHYPVGMSLSAHKKIGQIQQQQPQQKENSIKSRELVFDDPVTPANKQGSGDDDDADVFNIMEVLLKLLKSKDE